MTAYVFDIEADGLLDELTKVHSIVLRDPVTGELVGSYADQKGYEPLAVGVTRIEAADLVIGHNIDDYDLKALAKVYPTFKRPKSFDTMIAARVAWPADKLKEIDQKLKAKGTLPGNMFGRHSLEAWGYRLGEKKVGLDITDWSTWTPYMHERCEQDCLVNVRLYQAILKREVPAEVYEMEHEVAAILRRQEAWGFRFDVENAEKLAVTLLKRKAELEAELVRVFPPWEIRTPFTPKSSNKKLGYVKGVPTEKVRTIVFNPASRDHIADRLMKLRGWKPKEFTAGGKPQVDESTISDLPYPEAKMLTEYLMVGKRLGQLYEGKEALMKAVRADGRIHGRVNPNGANTYRMTHSGPNMAQVPSVRAPYGKEFRALLMASVGMVLVGADAEALELRCLAHFMARFDNGAYIKTVLEGKKEDGTDIHSVNSRALGLDPKKKYPIEGQLQTGRDIAKVWFYAFIYGAGDYKLGTILGIKGTDGKIKLSGKTSRARFLKALPALKKLIEAVKAVFNKRGYLVGLDGRKLFPRNERAALNTLLQSAGALLMKKALVILDRALKALGLVPGVDYEFCANVHDEWQIDSKENNAEQIGQQARASIVAAGEAFHFRCPLDGAYSIGKNWADTH